MSLFDINPATPAQPSEHEQDDRPAGPPRVIMPLPPEAPDGPEGVVQLARWYREPIPEDPDGDAVMGKAALEERPGRLPKEALYHLDLWLRYHSYLLDLDDLRDQYRRSLSDHQRHALKEQAADLHKRVDDLFTIMADMGHPPVTYDPPAGESQTEKAA